MPSLIPKPSSVGGYSADVRIDLHVNGKIYSPTHTASDFLIFRKPQAIEPSMARLIVSVGGEPHESAIEILPYESPNTRIPVRILHPVRRG